MRPFSKAAEKTQSCFALDTEQWYWPVTVQSLWRVKKVSLTSNVLPIHFDPSQSSSSQVDSYLQYSVSHPAIMQWWHLLHVGTYYMHQYLQMLRINRSGESDRCQLIPWNLVNLSHLYRNLWKTLVLHQNSSKKSKKCSCNRWKILRGRLSKKLLVF